jgi:hypothetical protein
MFIDSALVHDLFILKPPPGVSAVPLAFLVPTNARPPSLPLASCCSYSVLTPKPFRIPAVLFAARTHTHTHMRALKDFEEKYFLRLQGTI